MEPGGERRSIADGGGFPGQDEERGLKRVFGVGAVIQHAAADLEDKAAMTLHDGGERGFVTALGEASEQIGVGRLRGGLAGEDRSQVAKDGGHFIVRHEEGSGKGQWKSGQIIF
jgi:hypothetical protein